MKKITFLAGLAALSFGAVAQNWVPTTPQKKKVVLEEFTGVRCTFCPDGHKIAQALKDANPGNVILVNIHSGSFAAPRTGYLNLTTPEGDVIDDASGLTGYPAGSVNRIKNPRAESRTAWGATAATILAQNSPVNVYVKGDYNRETRELTTQVELFYTANSATATNKLTVMLLQDNILGTQIGADRFFPENMIGDQYIHSHALRDVLSPEGAWGETIDTTTEGTYVYREYKTTLPESIGDIDLSFYNLNVVAFVSEGDNNNILSGHESKLAYDQTGLIDLSMANFTNVPTGVCVEPFTPSVEVMNSSDQTITSFSLSANINGSTVNKTFNGSLAPNGKTVVTFENEIVPRGEYSVNVNGFTNINDGSFIDTDLKNDFITLAGFGLQKTAFEYGKFGMNGAMDLNSGKLIKENSQYNLLTSAGHSGGAVRYSIHESWGLAGRPGELVFGEADFTNATDPEVSYWYAYSDGDEGGTAPTVTVSVSEDCGVTFKEVDSYGCVETGQPAVAGNFYVPVTSDYRQVKVDLSAYAGKSVIINIAGIPGNGGNALYIDEVEIGSAAKIASVSDIALEGVSVYPNPANSILNIEVEEGSEGTITLTDINGRLIATSTLLNGTAKVNTADFKNGIYILSIRTAQGSLSKRVTVAH